MAELELKIARLERHIARDGRQTAGLETRDQEIMARTPGEPREPVTPLRRAVPPPR